MSHVPYCSESPVSQKSGTEYTIVIFDPAEYLSMHLSSDRSQEGGCGHVTQTKLPRNFLDALDDKKEQQAREPLSL
jgi:hypothetical protein